MGFKKIGFLLTFSSLSLFAGAGYFEPWGSDIGLIAQKNDKNSFKKSTDLLTLAAEKCILFHQNVISPVDGPRSHFRPTSARYMLLAIRRYGLITGYLMGCDRLIRENQDPWVYRTRNIAGKEYKWDPTYKPN